jgi:hypothetical protein
MFAIQAAGVFAFPNWGFWGISLVAIFIAYLIGFNLGHKRAGKG